MVATLPGRRRFAAAAIFLYPNGAYPDLSKNIILALQVRLYLFIISFYNISKQPYGFFQQSSMLMIKQIITYQIIYLTSVQL